MLTILVCFLTSNSIIHLWGKCLATGKFDSINVKCRLSEQRASEKLSGGVRQRTRKRRNIDSSTKALKDEQKSPRVIINVKIIREKSNITKIAVEIVNSAENFSIVENSLESFEFCCEFYKFTFWFDDLCLFVAWLDVVWTCNTIFIFPTLLLLFFRFSTIFKSLMSFFVMNFHVYEFCDQMFPFPNVFVHTQQFSFHMKESKIEFSTFKIFHILHLCALPPLSSQLGSFRNGKQKCELKPQNNNFYQWEVKIPKVSWKNFPRICFLSTKSVIFVILIIRFSS